MPTLASLVRSDPDVRILGQDTSAARPVAGVWAAGEGDPPHGWQHLLAVLPPGIATSAPRLDPLIRRIAQAGAAGIAAAAPVPTAVMDCAHRYRMPIVSVDGGWPAWMRLAAQVSNLRSLEDTRAFIDLAARGLGADVSTAADLLHWLGASVGGNAMILDPHEPVPQPESGPPLPTEIITRLMCTTGPAGADTAETDGWLLRLHAVGPAAPRPVLVVMRRGGPWPAAAVETIGLTVRLLTWWAGLRAAGDHDAEQIREGVCQLIIGGDVFAARRLSRRLALAPRLLGADQARVYVAGGPAVQRQRLTATLHHRLGDDAVVICCPVDLQQTIAVTTVEDKVDDAVRDVLRAYPGYAVGVSLPVPIDAVAAGHEQATRALGPARVAEDRYARYTERIGLAQVLPAENSWRWARHLLKPFDLGAQMSARRREEMLMILRMWLAYGPVGAAALTHTGRNTPTRIARETGSVLGLDLELLADRIRLDIALRIDALHPYAGEPPAGQVPADLTDLLKDTAVQRWGAEFHDRLEPSLVSSLTVWITHGQHTATAATALGIHPRTLLARLRRAEAEMEGPLISHPAGSTQLPDTANGITGVHDLVIALHTTNTLTTIMNPG